METGMRMFRKLQEQKWTAGFASLSRRGIAAGLIYMMIPMGLGDVYAYAQEAPPPPPDQQQYDQGPPPPDQQQYDQGAPPQAYQALSPQQLNDLVAPIALYPDSLVAQVLAAATYPSQVVDADRWMDSNGGAPPEQLAEMANGMPWDPSVKSLTAFPSVLDNMNRNLDWTTQLGDAYYNQPQDVMNAVQSMRQAAYESGQLRSTPQEYVTYQPGYVTIVPANSAVMYVPYYDPWTVYGSVVVVHPWYHYYYAPPRGVVFGALAVGFGVGIAVGAFAHWGWGYDHWHPDWHNRTILYNRGTYISRSVTVVNHGYYGRFDRNAQAREFNRNVAMHAADYRRNEPARGSFADHNAYRNNVRQPVNRNWAGEHQNNAQHYQQPRNNARPTENFNRGQQNFNRGQQQNYNRGNQNYARPQQGNRGTQNYNRGQQNNRQPARQSHPANNHPKERPQNHGGGHENHGGHEHGHGRR